MNFSRTTYTNDMEILYTAANLVLISGTVLAANVAAGDEHGKKYILSGSFIDKDGNVVKEDKGALVGTPVGVLYKTVDVTDGDQPGSLVIEGYLRADRVLDGYSDASVTAIKTALPNIKFR